MNLLKLVTVSVAVLLSAAVMAGVPLAVPSASAVPVPIVKCQSLEPQTNSSSAPSVFSGCNRPGLTGGSGIWTTTLTWSTGKETNFSATGTVFVPGRCQDSQFEYDFRGIITTVSGRYTKRFLGDTATFDVCLVPMPTGSNPDAVLLVGLVPGAFFTIPRSS